MSSPVPQFSNFEDYRNAFAGAVRILADASPLLKKKCVLHGSAPASVTYYQHRASWDIDFMSHDVRGKIDDVVFQLKARLPDSFRIIQGDTQDQMYFCELTLQNSSVIGVELFSNYLDDIEVDARPEIAFGGVPTATPGMYAQVKAQSCIDRRKAKDVHDLIACFGDPCMQRICKLQIIKNGRKGARLLQRALEGIDLEKFRDQPEGFNPGTPEAHQELLSFVNERLEKYRQRDIINAEYDRT